MIAEKEKLLHTSAPFTDITSFMNWLRKSINKKSYPSQFFAFGIVPPSLMHRMLTKANRVQALLLFHSNKNMIARTRWLFHTIHTFALPGNILSHHASIIGHPLSSPAIGLLRTRTVPLIWVYSLTLLWFAWDGRKCGGERYACSVDLVSGFVANRLRRRRGLHRAVWRVGCESF